MISELSDEEMLDFLMTSEFEGDISPAEFRHLLVRWRYFYRLLHGKLERTKEDLQHDLVQARNIAEGLESANFDLKVKVAQRDDKIHFMKNRKLTFRERWTGKIITKEDED